MVIRNLPTDRCFDRRASDRQFDFSKAAARMRRQVPLMDSD